MLAGLPPLSERVQQIRAGVAATNAADNDRRLERSQVRDATAAHASMQFPVRCASGVFWVGSTNVRVKNNEADH